MEAASQKVDQLTGRWLVNPLRQAARVVAVSHPGPRYTCTSGSGPDFSLSQWRLSHVSRVPIELDVPYLSNGLSVPNFRPALRPSDPLAQVRPSVR